jgi:hypothetical protein
MNVKELKILQPKGCIKIVVLVRTHIKYDADKNSYQE